MGLWKEIKEAASGHGHDCTCDTCMEEHHHHHHGLDTVMVVRLAVAAGLFIAGAVCENTMPTASLLLRIGSILCAGYDIFLGAAMNILRLRRFDENLLMSIVAIAAVIIGEAGEGATVILLFQIGELLQGAAVARVRHTIEGLMENRSPEAVSALAEIRSDKGRKGRTEEFITHFARIYTPAVMGIALVVAIVSPLFLHTTVYEGVYRALVLMVIACPCAIVISVPLSYFAGIGGAARHGILFKSTNAVDAVAGAGTVVFDKSGAMEGEGLRVVSVTTEKMDREIFLRVAAHACAYLDTPAAEAVKKAYDGTIYIELVESFQPDGDSGVAVVVDGVKILFGTRDYLLKHDIEPVEKEAAGYRMYLAADGHIAGEILLDRCPKSDIAETVTVLSLERQVTMITDDTAAAAENFARHVGIEEFYADCTQAEKVAVVRDIQSRNIRRGSLLYVGSAETDDACIREAEVGVSLYGASSDAAIQAADVVIMDGSPSRVITALDAAKRTRGIVWQNILFALGFKAVILILDMFGICPLWLAVFADVGVTLLAVLNSLRAFIHRDASETND